MGDTGLGSGKLLQSICAGFNPLVPYHSAVLLLVSLRSSRNEGGQRALSSVLSSVLDLSWG